MKAIPRLLLLPLLLTALIAMLITSWQIPAMLARPLILAALLGAAVLIFVRPIYLLGRYLLLGETDSAPGSASRMDMIPAHFKPPVQAGEFISRLQAPAESRIEVGVLFVGAGPASLAGAIRLAQLLQEAPKLRGSLGEYPIVVIEKGKYPGAHLLSGAVVNPVAFRRLFPDLRDTDLPFLGPVTNEALYLLTERHAFRSPLIPPPMRSRGYYVASLSKVGDWLAEKAEALGVTILNETAGVKLLVENGVVRGVCTGDRGLDKEGNRLPNSEAGSEMAAKVTLLGEGTTGHLTQAAIEHFGLKRTNPQSYALGVKEVWEVPKPLTKVIHTMGWPLRNQMRFREFGGSFVYPMGPHMISLGLVLGMGYSDASLSVHDLMQQMKRHPLFQQMLSAVQRIGWGAKTIPEGGFYSLPDRLNVPGALLVGDAAGFVNVPALKGIHYAMWSGILAAEAIFELLKAGVDPGAPHALDNYDRAVKASFVWRDLYRVRNMRQSFQYGFAPGVILAGLMTVTDGIFPGWRFRTGADSEQALFRGSRTYPPPDGVLTFDKLSSVYVSGNRSRDNQPTHLRIQPRVSEEVGEAWIHMCPASVYEWGVVSNGQKVVRVNPTNCIQCGAISAKGGRLTPPEGGSGPEYTLM
ncbi:MAG: 4Fe-4S dicluster domain-containing protein [Chloroflexi bacterium]|nr:4Fe-4S dicluster domain-containing protein [Chloroflexota bacterium]